MRLLALSAVAVILALAIAGCGEARVGFDVSGCAGHCDHCDSSADCCNEADACTLTFDGTRRCLEFPGQLCP